LAAAGWEDPHDAAIFDEASRMFWADVNRFGVNARSCAAAGCW
jgi:hypothetical protein